VTSTARVPVGGDAGAALAAALRHPRYEVMALPATADLVEQHLSRDAPVTVTISRRKGLEPTLALTEQLCRRGFPAVPHLAARLIVDEHHLAEVMQRMDEAGVTDVFVIAGDVDQPVGAFRDSFSLLVALHRLRQAGTGRWIDQVGIAGYPEGHPLIATEVLAEAMLAKQPLATYLVSQLCFDAARASSWLTGLRQQGVTLPVHIGIAGVVDKQKLLRIAGRIGVGSSARFLRRHSRAVARLVVPGGYRPDRLVRGLAPDLARPAQRIAGLHIYTLGGIAATERWRRRALARLEQPDAA